MLRQYIDPQTTISFIGIAKNAGKTTTLNKVLQEYQNEAVALTSVGLDGEKTDTVTFQPKPAIYVTKNMIVATAEECLKASTCTYITYEKTSIKTALGNIVIIEVTEDGQILLAGPSTKTGMIDLIHKLQKYSPVNIFIDGALFRKSIATTLVADAIILSTGASYHSDQNRVVKDTKLLVDQLQLDSIDDELNNLLQNHNKTLMISSSKVIELGSLMKQNDPDFLHKKLTNQTEVLYIKGALTNSIVEQLLEIRQRVQNLKLVVDDATHIVCDLEWFEKLKRTKIRLFVRYDINLLFVTLNPTSPFGYEFDPKEFKKQLQQNINHTFINVVLDKE